MTTSSYWLTPRILGRSWSALLLAVLFQPSTLTAQSIISLGTDFRPVEVSADGTVVAGVMQSDNSPARWTLDRGVQVLRSEPGSVTGMSRDGVVIVGNSMPLSVDDVWQWTEAGGFVSLPPPSLDEEDVETWFVEVVAVTRTNGKTIAIGHAHTSEGRKLLRWIDGGDPQIIPHGDGDGEVFDMSTDGSVIVGWRGEHPEDWDAVKWINGVANVLEGGSDEHANVSDDGKVVVAERDGGLIRWDASGRTVLSSESVHATGLSADGSVAVGRHHTDGQAFIWREGQGLRLLRDVLELEFGFDTSEFYLASAEDVSANGAVIVGRGRFAASEESWRVELCGITHDWANAASGDFATSENWSEAVVPDSSMIARFEAMGSHSVSFSDDARSGGLRVSGGSNLSFDLQGSTYTLEGSCGPAVVVDGSTLVVGGGETGVGKHASEGGTVTSNGVTEIKGNVVSKLRVVTGKTFEQAGGLMRIDGEDGAEAWAEILDGGKLTCGGVCAAGMNADRKGRIEVRGQSSTWDGGQLWVGVEGEGTLEVSGNGAVVGVERLEAASESGGIAAIRVKDAGLLGAIHGLDLASGADSKATLTVEGSGSAVSVLEGNILLGGKGEATVTVEGEGSFYSGEGASSVGGQLRMGKDDGGSGRLSVSGAGSSVDGFSVVEVGSDGHGELNLTSNARLERIGSLVLGAGSGRGTLSIKEEAEVSASELRLAVGQGSAAAAEVRGSGSLQAGALLEIGTGGTGSLVVDDGVLEGLTAQLGAAPGGTGSLFVSSAGRANLPFLVVGQSGLGSVDVNSGGSIQSTLVTIPAGDGSGSVSVTGGGSLLESNAISLGLSGSGTLEAFGGGLVRTNMLRVYGNGEVSGNVRATQLIIGTPPANKAGAHEGLILDSLLVYGEGAGIEVDTFVFNEGGVVGGTGPFHFSLTNTGTVAPEDTAGTTGTLRLADDYVQTASGVLDIELGGHDQGEYDRLEVAGTATLGGMLRLSTVDGYRPDKGERFEILTAGSVTGTFERIEGPEGIWVALTYGDTAVEVEILTGVAIEEDPLPPEELPRTYALEQNYPNPFNPSTEIVFALPVAAPARLVLYDLLGKELAVLIDRPAPAGTHRIGFDASGLPSGVYLYRLEAGAFNQTRRMVLTK